MSKRDYRLLIGDIIRSIDRTIDYTADMKTLGDFISDEKTMDAVVKNFEVIGEAASNVPEGIKSKYSDIDWSKMIGFRNILVHQYFGVNYEIVWNITKINLSDLRGELEKLDHIIE